VNLRFLDHLNLSISSFEDTVTWYSRVFGFKLVEEGVQDGTKWGVIRAGEALLCIYEYPDCELHDRFEMRKRGLHGLNHFGLRITDEKEWLDIIERENLEILYDGPIRWPHSTAWYLKDPTGWEIEVALWDGDHVDFD
jgi:catechol 2,3-dioxygenase-like lactoylglutathione lyase family enzyme